MNLSDLFLNRFLYRQIQTVETPDSTFNSLNSTTPTPAAVASGSAANDINTNNVTINGSQLTPGTIPQPTLDVSNWGWGQTCIFTSDSAVQVSWGAGTFTSAGGVSYSITAGNTGTMAAKTYIYLDLNVSSTAYQHTTTSANSVGIGKVLIAVAQNSGTGNATYNLSEATQIVGDNILANTINASKITAGSITATQIASSTITTSNLNFTPVQNTNVVASINASSEGITINGARIAINGSTTFSAGYDPTTKLANASGSVSASNLDTTVISGGKIITGLLTASNITTGTLDASVVTVSNLNASNITSGTISIGGTSQPGTIKIQTAGEGYSSAKIYWVNSSGTNKGRIWTDDNGYLGMNALGGQMYFYCNSNQALFVTDSAQSVFGTGGLKVQGSFNIGDVGGSTVNARINGGYFYLSNSGTGEYFIGQTGSASWLNSTTYTYLSVGGTAALRASSSGVTVYGSNALYIANANKIDFQSYTLTMNSNKTAIIPTSQGFRALYCTESPEVWFMDFCEKKDVLDPLFEEVTVAPYHYIKCEDGGYQVWGKRKGHEHLRFEEKTENEYIANEKFLNLNKPEAQLRVLDTNIKNRLDIETPKILDNIKDK